MSDIRKAIADIVADAKHAPISAADHEKPLKELGMDSLDIANILLAVEEKFDVKIPDADVARLGTLSAIVQYVESQASA